MIQTTSQQISPWPPKMVICVGAVVIHQQRILFVRQARGHALSGMWSIPWGFVDDGETPEAAALRETVEESGITATLEGLLGIQNLPTPGWAGIIFACQAQSGDPTPDGVETDRAAYFSLDEILSFTEPFEPWCKWLALRVLNGKCRVIPEEPGTPYFPSKAFL